MMPTSNNGSINLGVRLKFNGRPIYFCPHFQRVFMPFTPKFGVNWMLFGMDGAHGLIARLAVPPLACFLFQGIQTACEFAFALMSTNITQRLCVTYGHSSAFMAMMQLVGTLELPCYITAERSTMKNTNPTASLCSLPIFIVLFPLPSCLKFNHRYATCHLVKLRCALMKFKSH